MSRNEKVTIKLENLDVNKITCTKLQNNERSKNQKIAYVNYTAEGGAERKPLLQTPIVTLSTYGIPRKPAEDDAKAAAFDRTFIKVPMDPETPEGKMMLEKFTELDDYINNKQKLKLFENQKLASGYDYLSIVRRSSEDDTIDQEDKDKKQYPRPPYFKVKLDVDYTTKKINTKVYLKTTGPGAKRTLLTDIETIDDLTKYVRYQSKIRMILMPNKVWAANTKLGTSPKKNYGMSLKVMQLEVEPPVTNSIKDMLKDDAFVDDEENVETHTENVPAATEQQEEFQDEHTDEQENQDDDPAPEQEQTQVPVVTEKKPPAKQVGGRGKKKSNLDS